jgi:hypothetical protein
MTDSSLIPASVFPDIEKAEVQAWLDMYVAIPADFQQKFDPQILQMEGVSLTRCRAIAFSHFNSVLDLGVSAPATEQLVDALLQCYNEADVHRFVILHNPYAQPAELAEWLKGRGLHPKGAWERICRIEKRTIPSKPAVEGSVELVTSETASEWTSFLEGWYRLPTGPWLAALVGRPGWHHAVLRRSGRIVSARSMFTRSGWAWLGVEAPVPGLMTPSYEEDYALVHALVNEGLRSGVERFVADIEAPAASRDTPAYRNWSELGFAWIYLRQLFVRE